MEENHGDFPGKELKIESRYGQQLEDILCLQEEEYGRRWILFSDIDRTVYKEGIDNSDLNQKLEKGKWGFVTVTGRGIEEVIDLIKKGKLKLPHAIATRVGRGYIIQKQKPLIKIYHN
ncbi:MAG: hypothetical protein N2593_00970 [Patescibacteria group bacterium]|nr:hypothetical protein [Patescibacteria group bacterium]